MTRFLRFCMAGTVGFLIDASSLYLFVHLGIPALVARLFSFLLAVTGTWLLNRRYTFDSSGSSGLFQEWLHYLAVNGVGGAINYLCFALALLSLELVQTYPVLGVAIGSVVALFFNYFANKHLVFRAANEVAGR
jgi:putative flippase GtrA